ncbi:hypothetical protein [Parasitella parasitica]|uniref:DNA mismatch repair protein MutS core domain-containing protein n=1 Tax=Parasitella parasitica TaxID=35722 RepID=A0A0B7NX52_9FUNG|nr:hypothetical protein [Parasitella parasitica]
MSSQDADNVFSTQQTTKRGTIGGTNQSVSHVNTIGRPFSNFRNRPGTATTSIRRPPTTGTNSRSPKRVMAIAEGRGVAVEVGICVFDINSCEIIISQVRIQTDTALLWNDLFIGTFNLSEPQKILMPLYAERNQAARPGLDSENVGSKLNLALLNEFPHIPIVNVPRKYFNDEKGKQHIIEYCIQEDIAGLLFGASTKYYCLAALAGAFQHVLDTEGHSFSNHTIKFTYKGAEGSMLIDTITAKNLELVHNTAHTNSPRSTLLGIVDNTLTPMGKRLLRTNILQPPYSVEITNDRLNAIEELCRNEECIYNIQSCLKQLVDIDCIISFLVKIPNTSTQHSVSAVHYSEQKINHVIHLKQVMKSIKAIANSLPNNIRNATLQSDQYNLAAAINRIINQDIGIEKSSLGIPRQTYKETTEDIYDLIANYEETFNLKLKLDYTAAKGYSISIQINRLSDETHLPDIFIDVIQKKKTLQFTTLELLQKNSRLNESMTEVFLMSEKQNRDTASPKFQRQHKRFIQIIRGHSAAGLPNFTSILQFKFKQSCSP